MFNTYTPTVQLQSNYLQLKVKNSSGIHQKCSTTMTHSAQSLASDDQYGTNKTLDTFTTVYLLT